LTGPLRREGVERHNLATPPRWTELSGRTRKLIVVAATAETILKVVMLVDLWRRPAAQVRGSKGLWAATALVKSAGLAPLTYFSFGRRR
jgi:hypothetical protein